MFTWYDDVDRTDTTGGQTVTGYLSRLVIRWYPDFDAACDYCHRKSPTEHQPSDIDAHGETWTCPVCREEQVLYPSDLEMNRNMAHKKRVVG